MAGGFGLGIVVGSANSVAAVDPTRSGAADGSDHLVVERTSTLGISPDDAPVLGAARSAGGRHSNAIVLDGYASRVGDPVGILADDGATYSGEDLMATAVGCLVHAASAGLPGAVTVVAAYPTGWSHYTVDAFQEALERAGFGDVTPVPEASASVRWLESAHGPLDDGALVVYDLGASTLDISVVRIGGATAILGKPIQSEDIVGAEFDHMTMQYVLANSAKSVDFDPFDPAMEQSLSELRERCADAKEALSTDTETTVVVELDGRPQAIRLVRDELEDLLRAPLLTSLDLVHEAVRSAGLELTDVSQVLLTGGGAAIPLVAELVSSELGLPVTAGRRPRYTAALGAAMLADDLTVAAADIDRSTALPVIAPKPAPAVALRTELPVAPAPVREGMARWKKAAIVTSVAAAVTLLAAGGLSLGTGVIQLPQSPTSATESTPSPTGAAPAAGATTAPNGVPVTGSPAATGGSTVAVATAPGSGGAAVPAPGTAAQTAAGPGAPAPQAGTPAPQTPGAQVPPPATQPPAAQSPAPAPPSPPPGPANPPPAQGPVDNSPSLPGLPSVPILPGVVGGLANTGDKVVDGLTGGH